MNNASDNEIEETESIASSEEELKKLSVKEEDKFRLFERLEKHPCLWDSSKVDYKNKAAKTTALQTLAKEFDTTTNNLKSLLHGVRSSLSREMKKEKEGKPVKWKFYKTMAYMKTEITRSMKAKEEKEWADDENEQLIEFYSDNEILWNHTISSYKDRGLKDIAFQKLDELLPRKSQDDIKKQWNILKTIYYRESKREEGSKVSGAGTDSTYTSPWKYIKLMAFLTGYDKIDPPTTTMEDVLPYQRPAKKIKGEKANNLINIEETKLELYKEVINCLRTPLQPKPTESTIPTTTANDEISLFLKSLESSLRRLTGRQLAIARKRINDVMFEVDMDAFNAPPTANPCSTAASTISHLTDFQASFPVHNASMPFSPNTLNWTV